jgi:hypothetical protein
LIQMCHLPSSCWHSVFQPSKDISWHPQYNSDEVTTARSDRYE